MSTNQWNRKENQKLKQKTVKLKTFFENINKID